MTGETTGPFSPGGPLEGVHAGAVARKILADAVDAGLAFSGPETNRGGETVLGVTAASGRPLTGTLILRGGAIASARLGPGPDGPFRRFDHRGLAAGIAYRRREKHAQEEAARAGNQDAGQHAPQDARPRGESAGPPGVPPPGGAGGPRTPGAGSPGGSRAEPASQPPGRPAGHDGCHPDLDGVLAAAGAAGLRPRRKPDIPGYRVYALGPDEKGRTGDLYASAGRGNVLTAELAEPRGMPGTFAGADAIRAAIAGEPGPGDPCGESAGPGNQDGAPSAAADGPAGTGQPGRGPAGRSSRPAAPRGAKPS